MKDYKTRDDLEATRYNQHIYSSRVSRHSLVESAVALVLVILAAVALLFLSSLFTPAHANEATPSKVWVTPGALSYHLDRSKDHNETNIGIGVEYSASPDWSFALGQYRNSIDKLSRYALVGYTPWHPTEHTRIGVLAGAVNGYAAHNGEFLPVVAPVASLEYRRFGANVMLVPPFKDKVDGAIAVQLKFRF